jgi:hypothetical protein
MDALQISLWRRLTVREETVKELGHTAIENDTIIVGSYGSWKITYTAGRRGIEVGGALKLTFYERDVWNSLQYVSVTTSGMGRLEARVFNHFMKKEVVVKVQEERLNPGQTIAVTFGDKSKGCPGISVGRNHTAKDYVWKTYVDVKGKSNFINISEPQAVRVVADSPVEILVTAPSIVEAGEPFGLNIKAKDRFGNIADTFAGDIEITCSGTSRIPLLGTSRLPVQIRMRFCRAIRSRQETGEYATWNWLCIGRESSA